MSELNVYHHELRPNEYAEFYLKYEADKMIADLEESHKKEVGQLLMEIAELKAQKAQAEDNCAYWKTMAQKNAADNEVMAKQRADAFKREHHQKFKRCLAMARRCKDLHDLYKAKYDYDEGFGDGMLKWIRWATKWQKRWLAIAEEFKE